MTIEKLANMVKAEFVRYKNEGNFETFAEMKSCYDWEWKDIRDEVSSIITMTANDAYDRGDDFHYGCYDTCTVIYATDENGRDTDIPWKDFKKMVFADLK